MLLPARRPLRLPRSPCPSRSRADLFPRARVRCCRTDLHLLRRRGRIAHPTAGPRPTRSSTPSRPGDEGGRGGRAGPRKKAPPAAAGARLDGRTVRVLHERPRETCARKRASPETTSTAAYASTRSRRAFCFPIPALLDEQRATAWRRVIGYAHRMTGDAHRVGFYGSATRSTSSRRSAGGRAETSTPSRAPATPCAGTSRAS